MLQMQQQQARLLELQQQALHNSQPAKKARKDTVQDTAALRVSESRESPHLLLGKQGNFSGLKFAEAVHRCETY